MKTYIKPAIFIEKVEFETLLQSVSGPNVTSATKASSERAVEGKDRGDYQVEDNSSFGDLW